MNWGQLVAEKIDALIAENEKLKADVKELKEDLFDAIWEHALTCQSAGNDLEATELFTQAKAVK